MLTLANSLISFLKQAGIIERRRGTFAYTLLEEYVRKVLIVRTTIESLSPLMMRTAMRCLIASVGSDTQLIETI